MLRLVLMLTAAVFAVSGCSPAVLSTAPAALETVTVQFTPALREIQPHLAECAAETPGIGLVLKETPAGSLELDQADLSIRLGSPAETTGYTASLGTLEIRLYTNSGNPAEEISLDELTSLYTRQPGGAGNQSKFYAYLPGDDLRQAIETLLGQPAGRLVEEVPTQDALMEALATSDNAFGFGISGTTGEGVRALRISDVESKQLQIPVLAYADDEPDGLTRSLLACLQAIPLTSLP